MIAEVRIRNKKKKVENSLLFFTFQTIRETTSIRMEHTEICDPDFFHSSS